MSRTQVFRDTLSRCMGTVSSPKGVIHKYFCQGGRVLTWITPGLLCKKQRITQ